MIWADSTVRGTEEGVTPGAGKERATEREGKASGAVRCDFYSIPNGGVYG